MSRSLSSSSGNIRLGAEEIIVDVGQDRMWLQWDVIDPFVVCWYPAEGCTQPPTWKQRYTYMLDANGSAQLESKNKCAVANVNVLFEIKVGFPRR